MTLRGKPQTCYLDVSAEEAENLLATQGKDGNFIIRPSQSTAGNQSLSVRHNGNVVHIKIQNTGEVFDLYGGEQFSSLMDLVEFYKDGEKLKLQDGTFVRLSQPFFSSTVSDRCERWFHGAISSAEAKERLTIHNEGSFLIRESHTKEDSFVLSVRTGEKDNITAIVISKDNGKYEIGDGAKFNDLSRLVDHYRKHDIVVRTDNGNIKFTLQKAVNIGAIVATDIPSRTEELLKRFPGHDKDRDGFWEEFEQVAREEISSEIYNKQRIHGKKEENAKKNRFKNILPYDDTRVVLKDKGESDYINANYVKTSVFRIKGFDRVYIATQGCLKHTAGDFWRMLWQENTSIIVMITNCVEMGKTKCFQYWPKEEEGEKSMTFDLSNGCIRVELVQLEAFTDYNLTILNVTREVKKATKGDAETMESLGTRTIYHFHFPDWPDKMAPKDSQTDRILKFIDAINAKKATAGTGPLIVHCSAGIGRTGTFILIDIIMNEIKIKGMNSPIDIPKTLVQLRKMRSGLVQTDAQYKFVYLAIRLFIENLHGHGSKSQQEPEGIYANEKQEQSNKRSQPTASKPPSNGKPKILSKKPNMVYENLPQNS